MFLRIYFIMTCILWLAFMYTNAVYTSDVIIWQFVVAWVYMLIPSVFVYAFSNSNK